MEWLIAGVALLIIAAFVFGAFRSWRRPRPQTARSVKQGGRTGGGVASGGDGGGGNSGASSGGWDGGDGGGGGD